MHVMLSVFCSNVPCPLFASCVSHVPVAFSFYIQTACGLYRPTRDLPGPLGTSRGSPGPLGAPRGRGLSCGRRACYGL